MATQEYYELATFTFKDPSTTTASPAFADVAETLKSAPGALAVYFGEKIEHAGVYVLAIRWETVAAYEAFTKGPGFPAFAQELGALLDTLSTLKTTPAKGNLASALDAPCTEVFSALGTDDSFLENNLSKFLAGMEVGLHINAEAPDTGIVLLFLGWESREIHLAQKGEDSPITLNLHHVGTGRKSVDMYHVNFKKL
ncbi:hypothetical protein PT974_09157 [Cladobotryum mycophilum]|uniref:ABM domain-containing protein n=1 Tax=Cladobotryum mycophilum TaxID=491253 RepID=A0ABR0SFB9_9HYPO